VRTFAIILFSTTLAMALPSLALREGLFEFYTLSWFQVYFAGCVGVLLTLLSRLTLTGRNVAVVGTLALAMAVPVASNLLFAERFFAHAMLDLAQISEVQSPWHFMRLPGGFFLVSSYYTYLVYLLPLTALLCLWRLRGAVDAEQVYFWIACLFGLALLLQQLRLNYYGVLAGSALLLAYIPGITYQLFAHKHLSGDEYYQVTQKIYPAFARACAHNPGPALASPFDGHFIRYHTECSVISNSFLLTADDERMLAKSEHLLSLPAARLLNEAPYLKYVYVRRTNLFYTAPHNTVVIAPRGNPRDPSPPLVEELLGARADNLPPHFRLIKELYFPGFIDAPYARLFALDGG
jgi:hypothetical protein